MAPGLALIGGTTAGSNFLLDSDNNDVDRLAVYMADAGVVITGDDPVQNVVYHDQNGFGGGNGFEVALVQQQAEQGLLRSAATTGTIPVGTGAGSHPGQPAFDHCRRGRNGIRRDPGWRTDEHRLHRARADAPWCSSVRFMESGESFGYRCQYTIPRNRWGKRGVLLCGEWSGGWR